MKIIDNEIISAIKKLLQSCSGKILIIPHENPDGDAIGSVVGLGTVLFEAGFEITIITPNNYPSFLKWLETPVEIINYENHKKKVKQLFTEGNLIFCLDFNEIKRVGELKELLDNSELPKVLIDHHPNPAGFCNITISDISYSSTAELVYDFLVQTGYSGYFTAKAAVALFTGIMTDTGSFSYSISDPNTFRVLSELIAHGIDPDKIHRSVYDNYSADRIRLLGYCLMNKMVVLDEFRTSYISISKDELKRFNFAPGDTEGFVNYPLSINNIVFSALFIEREELIKVSLRSKGDFPANEFCTAHFNGGGHKNAAGGESYQTLEETILKFTQLLPGYSHLLNTV